VLRRLLATLTGKTTMASPSVPDFSMPGSADLKSTPSGLQYQVVRAGTGKTPKATDTVTVHYAGWLTNGTAFDSSYKRGQTASFPLNRVIPGWTEGLQLMQEGGTSKFVIPASLGYGARGAPPVIGPNATLVFQVELIKVG
jgi:FKBP-type peptidyl-prolyl cis-trans isomerase